MCQRLPVLVECVCMSVCMSVCSHECVLAVCMCAHLFACQVCIHARVYVYVCVCSHACAPCPAPHAQETVFQEPKWGREQVAQPQAAASPIVICALGKHLSGTCHVPGPHPSPHWVPTLVSRQQIGGVVTNRCPGVTVQLEGQDPSSWTSAPSHHEPHSPALPASASEPQ